MTRFLVNTILLMVVLVMAFFIIAPFVIVYLERASHGEVRQIDKGRR